jgi:2,5-diamino-6-(ribosylamino)-4(3H)-pyrimidinone 5'-phosphate reductase
MNRPYVILNAAMTLDGKITTVGGDSRISCKEDLDRVHMLRADVGAVMVGAGTVLADDPSLTVRRVRGKSPIRVVVDGGAKIPTSARVLKGAGKTIVAVSEIANPKKVKKLQASGAELVMCGRKEVDLRGLLKKLCKMGVKKLLLEGGSTLNWNMLKSGLVDEIRLSVAPCIVGGTTAKSLVGGDGFPKIEDGVKLKLLQVKRAGRDLLLIYRVEGKRC